MPKIPAPILLFNGECAVCRSIAHWVDVSGEGLPVGARIDERPIGDDPAALRSLNPDLDIWAAYETIHLLMPDGSMKVGGEAVAQVLRSLPNCRWFAWTFDLKLLGFRPFQLLLDAGYFVLADVRPLLGCESCGIPSPPVKFIRSLIDRMRQARPGKTRAPHFTASNRAVKPTS
jgi:predicted DCC family thiol-disulfide oxidoreductase YuxK